MMDDRWYLMMMDDGFMEIGDDRWWMMDYEWWMYDIWWMMNDGDDEDDVGWWMMDDDEAPLRISLIPVNLACLPAFLAIIAF